MNLFSDTPGALVGSPNPNPRNFKIVSAQQFGVWALLRVHYPDATTFEGVKLLVYKAEVRDLVNRCELDPHFSEDGLGPVARFEPTDFGYRLALSMFYDTKW